MDKEFGRSLMKLILAQGIWNDGTNVDYETGMTDMLEALAMAQASVLVSFLKTTEKCVPDEIAAGCKKSHDIMLKTGMSMWNAVRNDE